MASVLRMRATLITADADARTLQNGVTMRFLPLALALGPADAAEPEFTAYDKRYGFKPVDKTKQTTNAATQAKKVTYPLRAIEHAREDSAITFCIYANQEVLVRFARCPSSIER